MKEALEKGASFCAYQERYQDEVRKKLKSLRYDYETVEEVLYLLIRENFIDEERYAKAYAGGKFRVNKWGKNKITQELKNRNISEYCIRKGLAEIKNEDYLETLKQLLSKKESSITDKNQFIRKNKLLRFGMSKGYEYELIMKMIS